MRLIWGPEGLSLPLPSWLNTSIQVMPGVDYSAYKFAIIVVTLAVAAFLYVLVMRTRIGMLIRAGASNREMVGALGVNIKLLYTLVFGLGAALAGLAGLRRRRSSQCRSAWARISSSSPSSSPSSAASARSAARWWRRCSSALLTRSAVLFPPTSCAWW